MTVVFTSNDRDIHEAVQNLVEPNKFFADAVDARQVSHLFLTQREPADLVFFHASFLFFQRTNPIVLFDIVTLWG